MQRVEKCQNLYSTSNVIRMIKSEMLRSEGYIV
jgi:hypothetical protein